MQNGKHRQQPAEETFTVGALPIGDIRAPADRAAAGWRWRRTRVARQHRNVHVEVDGWAAPCVAALVLTRNDDGSWSITHTPTGKAVPWPCADPDDDADRGCAVGWRSRGSLVKAGRALMMWAREWPYEWAYEWPDTAWTGRHRAELVAVLYGAR